MRYDLVFAHLLDDFSGSPKVLQQTIAATAARGWRAKLYVGGPGDGFLSNCEIPVTRYRYRRSHRRLVTLFTYVWSQLVLFAKLLRDRSIARDAVVFVNTLLPFGASLYGKLTGRSVVYHIHEVSLRPAILQRALVSIARRASRTNVFVSDAHAQALRIDGVPGRRVYNALDEEFRRKAAMSAYSPRREGQFTVLMVASLRDYKGVPELLSLAASLVQRTGVRFEAVLNDEQEAIERYVSQRPIPENVKIHSRTLDTAAFYGRASLVLNLSRVDQWIETFGLTVLEAMAFGVPVIVPPVGGPAELVRDSVEGFLVDSRDGERLRRRVLELIDDPSLCERMSAAARLRAAEFSPAHFSDEICAVIQSVHGGPA
jgi:glycosyltransferase involved in cell wall biosynthesis